MNVGEEIQVQSSEGSIKLDSDMNSEINIWEDEDGVKFQSQSRQSYNKKFQVGLPVTHIIMHKTKNQIKTYKFTEWAQICWKQIRR